jgi:membrane fusion protein, heavy metal efflux system
MDSKTSIGVFSILLLGIFSSVLILKCPRQTGEDHGHEHEHAEVAHGPSSTGHPNEGKEEEQDSHPDQVSISEEARMASQIGLDTVKLGSIREVLKLNGKIIPNEDGLAHLFARFPGIVKEVRHQLGESVRKGDTLALVESNESLQSFAIRSQMPGTVIRKHITVGETVGPEEELYAVADLRTVWADFSVYRHDFPRLRKGQAVEIRAEGGMLAATTLAYLSPIGSEQTQTMTARAVLNNSEGRCPPGLFIQGEVLIGSVSGIRTVRREAVHAYEGEDAVFVRVGEYFEARPVNLGRRDSEWVEVLGGLNIGEAYATRNSFIVKSDLGKSEVGHEH